MIRAKKEKNWVKILYYIIEDNLCGKRERSVRDVGNREWKRKKR